MAQPKLRVLIIDDNADAAQALALLLQVHGWHADTVGDGASALEHAQASRPDAIILDLDMPGMNGFETAKQLREKLGRPAPRIIALTGHCGEEERLQAQQAGFDVFLVKPADPVEILRALP